MLQPNEREFTNIYGDYRCIGLVLQQSHFLTFILQIDLHMYEMAEVQGYSWWHCSSQQNNGSSLNIQWRGGQVHPHSSTEWGRTQFWCRKVPRHLGRWRKHSANSVHSIDRSENHLSPGIVLPQTVLSLQALISGLAWQVGSVASAVAPLSKL